MNSTNNWLSDLNRALKADPKRTGALVVLLALLVGLLGRALLGGGGKGQPASAGAAMVGQNPASALSVRTSQQGSFATQHSAGVSAAMQKWIEAPVSPVSRNLFTVRIDYFPVDGSRTPQSGLANEGFWSRLEKSMAVQSDQRDKRENLIANFTAQAAKLKLQSTMMGPQPRAMVNGELVAEGSVVAEFRVLKIEARGIIVEREGIRLEIHMK